MYNSVFWFFFLILFLLCLAYVHACLLSISKAFMSDGKFISVSCLHIYTNLCLFCIHTLPISANFLFLWCQVPDKFLFGIIDGSPVSQNSTGAHQTTMAFHMSLSHPVAWNHLLHTDWTIAAFKANLTFLIQFNNLDSLMILLIIILKMKQWIMFGKQYLLHSLSSEVCCQFMRSF